MRDITIWSVILRIFLAVLFGGFLGLERGMKNRPAGLRTYMLVCLGACLIMLTNTYVFQTTRSGDPMRLGAQVVSGIGFLGAGTIVVTRRNHIKGLTTAAGLWATAGVGLALGVGFYSAAIAAGVLIFCALTLLQRWDTKLHSRTRSLDLYVEIDNTLSLRGLVAALREKDLQAEDVQLDQDGVAEAGVRGVLVTLHPGARTDRVEIVERVRTIPGVVLIEEL